MNSASFHRFSEKQLTAMTWWCKNSPHTGCDALICDGAVRSGKTVCMSVSFISWAFYAFSDCSFAICGKTVASVKRNVITPLLPLLTELGFSCKMSASKNLLEISRDNRTNRFYLFGGRDESSASLIQGMTLAGVLLDEVALMPRSFVEQAIARCSVANSRLWFNCNPENPGHWFYKEWILKANEKNCLYLHFTMADNPSLSKRMRERYKALYSGAFYERFVEGRWVAAEGLVYPFFDEKQAVPRSQIGKIERYIVSCDYGTVNPMSMGLWGLSGGVWYRVAEYYHDSKAKGFQRTDEEYYGSLCELVGDKTAESVIVDPSAASFIACIRRHGRFPVQKAKNDVADGIRKVSDKLKSGEIAICNNCKDILREFTLYRWEENAKSDAPRKQHDHAMDDMRYFVATALCSEDDGFFAVTMEREGKHTIDSF